MALRINGWTPTQARLWELLKGGEARTIAELCQALNIPDDEDALNCLKVHLCKMRPRLRERKHDIVCVFRERQRKYKVYRVYEPE